ncbi:PaaX family transcriptional regulator C-terminal domain-containing protein [Tomitella fengzijianii]|uniref:PaaX family transcriptional regulator n=1 Tax=Tomitella fengzijianii TaxID=2597660 RepID=UPI0018EEDFB7|nr:PaaX family transcriptional regulator C-terminal domain-containing protein [Tomitella fengzijianii]
MSITDAAGTSLAAGRAELGGASARSLLLTVLGEFVYPRGADVWTSTLLESLGTLGVEEKSARQAIARASAEGLLESMRDGRRTRWSLTAAGAELLREGTARIYTFLADEHDWDGLWVLLSVAVPEAQRKLRHRLRTQLTWLGMGSPAPGLWVVPDAAKLDELESVLDGLGLRPSAFVWTGQWAEIGERQALIEAAWKLDEVGGKYREFTDVFVPDDGLAPADAFAAQVRLVQAWRRFPFLDPDLPARLLPDDWPGPDAARAFRDCHASWHEPAQSAWEAWEAGAG